MKFFVGVLMLFLSKTADACTPTEAVVNGVCVVQTALIVPVIYISTSPTASVLLQISTGTGVATSGIDLSTVTTAIAGKQATDTDLDDLADGSLTGSKIGGNISGNAANITGNLSVAQIDLSTVSSRLATLGTSTTTLSASTATLAAQDLTIGASTQTLYLARLSTGSATMGGQLTNTSSITVTGGSGATYSIITSSGINMQNGVLTMGYTVNNFTIPSSSWNIVCVCPAGSIVLSGGCVMASSIASNLTASYPSTGTTSGLWGVSNPTVATTTTARSWACKWSAVSTTAQCSVTCGRLN